MSNKRILLINPPVYDLRIDWARWHQPCGLLRIGGLLQRQKKDVRLIDCLQPSQGDRLERKKIGTVSVEGIDIPRWHLGWDWYQVAATIEGFKKEKWKPDAVYVTCMMTFWWEAARDLIRQIQTDWLPKTPVFLGGVYSAACPNHAAKNFA